MDERAEFDVTPRVRIAPHGRVVDTREMCSKVNLLGSIAHAAPLIVAPWTRCPVGGSLFDGDVFSRFGGNRLWSDRCIAVRGALETEASAKCRRLVLTTEPASLLEYGN